MLLEGRLQEEIVEKEKLTVAYQDLRKSSMTFAQVAASAPRGVSAPPVTEKKKLDYKVMLVKPLKDNNTRDNDEIKTAIKDKLKSIRNKLRIREIKGR